MTLDVDEMRQILEAIARDEKAGGVARIQSLKLLRALEDEQADAGPFEELYDNVEPLRRTGKQV